jgi:hypothetical protein
MCGTGAAATAAMGEASCRWSQGARCGDAEVAIVVQHKNLLFEKLHWFIGVGQAAAGTVVHVCIVTLRLRLLLSSADKVSNDVGLLLSSADKVSNNVGLLLSSADKVSNDVGLLLSSADKVSNDVGSKLHAGAGLRCIQYLKLFWDHGV